VLLARCCYDQRVMRDTAAVIAALEVVCQSSSAGLQFRFKLEVTISGSRPGRARFGRRQQWGEALVVLVVDSRDGVCKNESP